MNFAGAQMPGGGGAGRGGGGGGGGFGRGGGVGMGGAAWEAIATATARGGGSGRGPGMAGPGGFQGPPGNGVGQPPSGFLTRNQLDSHDRGLNYIPFSGKGKNGWGFSDPTIRAWMCGNCRAECFMHRKKCFKCQLPRPATPKDPKWNGKLVPVKMCKCGCELIVKHGDCGTEVSFFDIPLDVFLPVILKFLTVSDICSLSQIDKENNNYFNSNEIWRSFYISEKVKKFYPEKLISLSNQKTRKNSTMTWTPAEVGAARCTLVIHNVSSIPMDVYWVSASGKHKLMSKGRDKKHVNKSEKFITSTYPNHKWFCVPTEEWMLKNPCSNVGFSFVVNVLELTDHKFDKTSKLAFVRKIHEPRDLKPIKGANKDYAYVKKEYMKLVLNLDKLNEAFRKNSATKERYHKDIQRLTKTLKTYQRDFKATQKKEKALMHAQSVVKQK